MFNEVDDKFGEGGLVANVGLDENGVCRDGDGGLGFLRSSHKNIITYLSYG